MNQNIDYNETLAILNSINPVNQDEADALAVATALCKKEMVADVVINTSEMDEFCNDYYYECPTCDCTIFEEHEFVGRCDCGQVIRCPRFEDWGNQFQKEHRWDHKFRRWVKIRKGSQRKESK